MATTVTSERSMYEETLLDILPAQGYWSEEAYLWLTDQTNRLIEFTDGRVEILPMPTKKHQAIVKYLFLLFHAVMEQTGGTVFFAALRLRIAPRKFREPDLMLLSEDDSRGQDRYWLGADLVLEVVSRDKPERDLVEKRREYAEAAIPEYWIVNPEAESITVLTLDGAEYAEHGVFPRGTTATSVLLPGFAVSVDTVLDAK
jgi:Uma2 family endonuclease